MNNKLDNEQEKRFDDKFTTGIGGVLVSRGGTSVVAEEVKQHIADEIAMAREQVEQDMIKKIKLLTKKEHITDKDSSRRTYEIAYNDALLDIINSLQDKEKNE